MHLMGYSYRGLEFALLDSASVQRFARVDPFRVPRSRRLQSAVGAIDADTWQAINGVLSAGRQAAGDRVGYAGAYRQHRDRLDILEPSDQAACCTTGCGC